jgi:hypothetical protein
MANEAEAETKGGARRKLLLGGSVLLVVLLIFVGYWNRNLPGTKMIHPDPDVPFSAAASQLDPRLDPPAPPEMVALLGGLKVGSPTVNGWKVAALTVSTKPEVKGALTVWLRNGSKSLAVWVANKGSVNTPPAWETPHHVLFAGMYVEVDFVEVMIPVDDIVQRVRAVDEQGVSGAPPAPAATP